jgi:mannose-6-phosphate isomerase-like protein (cupin superfamily)
VKQTLILLFFAAAGIAAAADPPGFVHWRAADLKAETGKLAAKVGEKKLATAGLGKFSHHAVLLTHRQGNGEVEVHEAQADVFVVQSGEATLVTGGEVVDGRTTAPGEIRGTAIRNGEKTRMAAGDILHIPARMPHQVLMESDTQFTYVILKVNVK